MPQRIYFRDAETGTTFGRYPIDAKDYLADPKRYERVPGPAAPKPIPTTTQGKPIVEPAAAAPVPPPPPPPPEPELPQDPAPPAVPRMVHKGFGKYEVLKADGARAHEDRLDKAGAEALLATLEKAEEE